jgi:type II secretory pathway predicted ATPase ExeA
MVESFFGLASRPFCVAPSLHSYVQTPCCQQAIENSIRCVTRGQGPSLIVGGAGLGKTICALKIADTLGDSMQVALLSSSQICTRRALLQSILYHLGLPFQETGEGSLRIQLLERLIHPFDTTPQIALVIDEAQTLSVKLLDEIRILTNTLYQGNPAVHLVLVGTLKLEDTLAHPHMESLNQRIVSRQYLSPLTHNETLQYVRHKIQLAGGDPANVFEPSALDAIYRASDGIPRLIEQLADQAILQSAIEQQRPIPASRISAVWTQMHQLPSPWQETYPTSVRLTSDESDTPTPEPIDDTSATAQPLEEQEPDGVIEFGSLDEETATVNLFQPFIEDPIRGEAGNPAFGQSPIGYQPSSYQPAGYLPAGARDESFRQMIKDLNLSAIQLQPSEHAFIRAEQTEKRSPKPAASTPPHVKAIACELVGVSVDGDDRDMIVVIEEQDWVNPFAIR